MSLLSNLLKRGRIDAPDFYLDLPALPTCPRCGSNASVYIFNGTDLVCPPCRFQFPAGASQPPISDLRPGGDPGEGS